MTTVPQYLEAPQSTARLSLVSCWKLLHGLGWHGDYVHCDPDGVYPRLITTGTVIDVRKSRGGFYIEVLMQPDAPTLTARWRPVHDLNVE